MCADDRSLCADDAVSLCADDSFAMCADDSLSMCADDALTAQTLSCYRALCSSHFLHDAGQGNWHWRWVRRGQVRARVEESKRCCVSDSKWKASPETKENCAISVLQRRAAQPLSQKVWCFGLWEIFENLPRFCIGKNLGGKILRWNEMEGGLRWLKQLHQPESPAKAFIECGRSFRGDSDASGTKRCMDQIRTPDDFWRQQGQFDDILFDVHLDILDCIQTAEVVFFSLCIGFRDVTWCYNAGKKTGGRDAA